MNEHHKNSMNWFREKYPMEYFLSEQIGQHVNEIFTHFHPTNEIHQIPLYMFAVNRDGTMALAATEVSKMFYGSLSYAIMKMLVESLESSISEN